MAPKAKAAASNGAPAKGKQGDVKATPATSGTATPVTTDAEPVVAGGFGKPNKAAYDAEQEKIKAEIDALQAKMNVVKQKISGTNGKGEGNDRRAQLRAELDSIRGEQSKNKTSRSKIIEQMKAHNENVQKKVKELQAAKGKTTFKTVEDVDARIKDLERQIDSGNLKLADEKRALAEISANRRARRTVESFQSEQAAIEAERAKADELRKQLDDPESKAVSDRYDQIKAELDEIKKLSDEAYAGRSKLFDERTALSTQLDALYNQKRESAQNYREANDRYYQKVNEERARKAERFRAQKAAEEEARRKEVAERVREEAEAPAYQTQIEDCQTLIDYFSGKGSGITSTAASTSAPTTIDGVPQLEIRQIDSSELKGMTQRKKKGEDEENYFVAKKGGKGGKKGAAAPKTNGSASPAPPADPASVQLNMPLPTLTALLGLSIPPPSSQADVPRAIEDLKTKKAWFEANQARQTAENIAKAEAQIKKLTAASKSEAPSADLAPPNGSGERPAEPAPTPARIDDPSDAVPADAVAEKLETVQETGAEPSVVEA